MSDNRKKSYEAIADVAEFVAGMHSEHKCAVRSVASEVAAYARHQAASSSAGPAQMATEAYRTAWDVTFGGTKATVGQA